MALIHAAAVLAGLIEVECPHCHRRQKKPRRPVTEFRVCRHCHRRFPFTATERSPRAASSRGSRRPR